MSIGANFRLASGYTGQTTETLALPGDSAQFERVVGVPLKSYVSLSWTYYFKKMSPRRRLWYFVSGRNISLSMRPTR
jgi:hypothetical protein